MERREGKKGRSELSTFLPSTGSSLLFSLALTFVPQRRNTSEEHRRDGDLCRASEKESMAESPDAGGGGGGKENEEGKERKEISVRAFLFTSPIRFREWTH